MAPKSSPAQSSLSQRTKQQSISSFFTPKPSQPAKTVVSKPAASKPASPPIEDGTSHAPQDASSNEDNVLPISRFSRKRAVDEDGETTSVDGAAPPASKRVRSIANNGSTKEDNTASGHRPSLGQASAAAVNSAKIKSLSDRTSKYVFSSSPAVRDENENEEDVMVTQAQKEKLHEKFVKKLGRPDSFAELRRRNKIISEETAEGEEGGEDEEEEEEMPKPTKGKKGAASKKSASKLTPMDKQYLDIKRNHLDAIIVMEVGYKFKIYGEDARIASKELGIVCIPGKFRYDERM